MQQKITQLTEEWWEETRIRGGKDHDCHWWIEIRWSYGYAPVYTVIHQGNLAGRIEKDFNDQVAAEHHLVQCLKEALESIKKIEPE